MTIPKKLPLGQFCALVLHTSKSNGTNMKQAGRLVFDTDGMVLVKESFQRLFDTADHRPRQRMLALPLARELLGEGQMSTAVQAVAPAEDWKERKERAQAEMAEMDVAQRRGQLYERDTVVGFIATATAQIRGRLELLPDQLAPVLTASSDEQFVRSKLAEEIEAALGDLAHSFGKLAIH